MNTYTPTYSPSYISDLVGINPNPDSVSPNSRITNSAPGSLGYYWKHHRSGPSFRVGGLALQSKEARKANSIPSTTVDKPHLAYPLADSNYIYTQQQSGQSINPNYYSTPAGNIKPSQEQMQALRFSPHPRPTFVTTAYSTYQLPPAHQFPIQDGHEHYYQHGSQRHSSCPYTSQQHKIAIPCCRSLFKSRRDLNFEYIWRAITGSTINIASELH
ncbi:hypothetical protein K457DRAFT_25041 [Linnemannia elongata AG-77]|uniref:Uncharacterized protein n=1 Tax=Linnemannia elongata AG-77 TaxID=1314771 RepID=A0A197JED5_9FUNG|nr:hypothetical protein K457DRAFT_25041 [Linnemannia elongata AG-77]